MAGTQYQLTMSVGPNPGKVFPLEKAEVVIGRDSTSDIAINDLEVSRKHAHLVAQQGGYLLEDLGSTNGTEVDDIRLTSPHALLPGEVIGLGEHVKLLFEAADLDPEATQVSIPVPPLSAPRPVAPVEPQVSAPYVMPKPTPAPTPAPAPMPTPSFSGQVPLNPIFPKKSTERMKIPMWMLILIIVIMVIILSCVAFLIFVDSNSLWCTFFPFISGCP